MHIYNSTYIIYHSSSYCTVRWSDLALFRFLKTYTFLLIRNIFKISILNNRQFRPRARQSFFFITGTLKNQQFFENFYTPSYYIKEQYAKRKFPLKQNLFNIHFYFSKMNKTVFDLYKVKIHFLLNLTLFLAFEKNQRTHPPGACSKNC